MEQSIERAVRLFREKISIFHDKRYIEQDRSVSIDLYKDIVKELEGDDKESIATLIHILNDVEADDIHYWVYAALQGLAYRGMLSYEAAQALLKNTERFAYADAEEWFKSIHVLACSSEGIRVLFEFVENRLLQKRDIRNWRWLAFSIVGSVLYYAKTTVVIPDAIKEKLKAEAKLESDLELKTQFQEIVDCFS